MKALIYKLLFVTMALTAFSQKSNAQYDIHFTDQQLRIDY